MSASGREDRGAALLCLVTVRGAEAHALAQRYDLPLPLGFFLVGAGAAVAVSFVVLACSGEATATSSTLPIRPWMQGAIPRPIVGCCKAIGGTLLLANRLRGAVRQSEHVQEYRARSRSGSCGG